ncbi:MAG: thioredoxin [Alphaproteobacteria bacterium HGW-Alphaproteobacteria-14]|nr:MAG: thioredoxin [Alphaproteobacteria bacterium HGW-Alphaproteobacteria-14]
MIAGLIKSLLAVPALAMMAAPAAAAQVQKFDEQALANAQAQGRPVLVDVYADWCSVCKVQHKQITAITADPAYDRLLVLRLNYDTQKAERRKLNVPRQSTLIAFKGRTESGRVIAATDRATIAALLKSTL